ncbi:MAG: MFS transporter [Nocardioidaceae bacterium]
MATRRPLSGLAESMSAYAPGPGPHKQLAWSPWRTVVAFGAVSLAGDMVYEGMRSVAGPFLGSLGASALVVGLITGAGEAMALFLRLFSGPLADRSGRYWSLTILGYGMTAVCVPLLAVAPFVGSLGLALAATLILLERAGKAIRSPSKSALLARVAVSVGRGRGFAVHKALDQVGALAGPLVVAGVIALAGVQWPAFAVLAIPGAVCMLLLSNLKRHSDDAHPESEAHASDRAANASAPVSTLVEPRALPVHFYAFAVSCALGTLGLMTFGVISYHLVDAGLVTTAVVPLLYAAAMATEAVAALGTGFAYDRWGAPSCTHCRPSSWPSRRLPSPTPCPSF